MVKQMRGVPGVTPVRLEEAMRVRHCALSLVGEPIMYPEINTFVDLLHEQDISSFMVTNAQFPEQLRDLKPVTQLYLSIDAPTPEELKRVDRPLFEDYWERCLACVRELRRKPQRTVFRLTLVNQYNTENVAAYADLVRLGWPDFIEVKGVTYCGTSTTSTLTMKENVPRHVEVVRFCEALCEALASCAVPKDKDTWLSTEAEVSTAATEEAEAGDDAVATETEATTAGAEGDAAAAAAARAGSSRPYNIACEHEHSCCVLIALRRFRVNGVWHTWIDYDKFTALARSGRRDFTAAEYAAPTPSWAVFSSEEKGFDPTQVRVRRKGGNPTVVTSGC
ncbi:tRNA wybutosine-synthesizing protein 1 [Trypanosoma grayi]|uniref:tRNA wybutosine-synthesizing protein 1 n=1 Tax=Trypanosoma grayi TaxID=71804 RepID=UPI0004F426D0|nr:tRNA wybutosine-synthesizing protein 1 [Trypanosoma grayi]KEG08956.1 tRNA wybutosine-synthesizing protein 1 [Trypanosoma grayi]